MNHCTHWTQNGEQCCQCWRLFPTISAAMDSPDCLPDPDDEEPRP